MGLVMIVQVCQFVFEKAFGLASGRSTSVRALEKVSQHVYEQVFESIYWPHAQQYPDRRQGNVP